MSMTLPHRLPCEEARILLVEFHEGELARSTAELVEKHVKDCAGCRSMREELLLLDAAFAAHTRAARQGALSVDEDFTNRVASAMHEESRAWRALLHQSGAGEIRTTRSSLGGLFTSRSMVAAVAAILIVGFVAFVRPPAATTIRDVVPSYQAILRSSEMNGGGMLTTGRLMSTGGTAGIELPMAPTDSVAQMARMLASTRR